MVEMSFRTRITGMDFAIIKGLLIIAAVRSLIIVITIVSMKQYRSFLVQEEHENRYRKLMLLTSSFKSEIYFMNKNINEIEDVMKKSYMVYKFLDENSCHNEIKDMALDIAKDVHEIKKDYISVIRGLEGMSKDNVDVTSMDIKDIISILEQDTMEHIKSNKLDININFKIDTHFTVKDHFYLMAVLRNLVNNSIEAIGSSRSGSVELLIYSKDERYVFKVSDNGSGIKEGNLDFIFNPGFSTKFDKSTGKIERGLGLTLVRDLVRDKFEGEISVESEERKGATFELKIPKHVFRSE
jgi:two-component system sensor histidine kinase YcbA